MNDLNRMTNAIKQLSVLRAARYILVGLFAFSVLFITNDTARAATFTVTSTADSGAGSLRQAIIDANASGGADQIDFSIAGAGQHTITLASSLPTITSPVTLNGLSQSGATCNGASTMPMVVINLNGNTNAFKTGTGATGSEINGLAVYGAGSSSYGLMVQSDDTTLRCNFFGSTDGETSASVAINSDWVHIDADNITVGGSALTDTNYFMGQSSGNTSLYLSGGIAAGTATISHNNFGVNLDGTSTVGAANGISVSAVYSSLTITDNHLGQSGIAFGLLASGSSGILIQDNIIGTDSAGMTAFASTKHAVDMVGDYSAVTISGNIMATSGDNAVVAMSDGVFDGVTVENNYMNVSVDGNTPFANNALGLYLHPEDSQNVSVTGNTIFAELNSGILIEAGSNALITGNTIGLNADASSCFASQVNGIGLVVTESVVGGTGPSDSNKICVDGSSNGISYSGASGANVSVLGNSVTTNNYALNVSSPLFGAPVIRAINESGGNTSVVYDIDLPAGNYRIQFYQNAELLNSGNHPNLTTYLDYATITSDGSGVQQFTKNLTGTGHTYLAATATQVDLSTDGFGITSVAGLMQPQADLQVTTTDGVTELDEGVTPHEITQTLTNAGPSTITDIDFNVSSSTCFSVTNVATSGTATDTGSYTGAAWSGTLESGQSLILTFTGDVTCMGGNSIEFTHSITQLQNQGTTVTDSSEDDSYSDTTNIMGPQADLQVTTTDGVTELDEGVTPHEITQTITNAGPSIITDIDFNLSSSTCFDVTNVATSGTATDTGSYTGAAWSGTLESGQSLILTFTGDVTCMGGNSIEFTHSITQLQNQGTTVTDSSEDDSYSDTTNIVGPQADASVTKVLENPQDLAVGATLHYTLTLTNNGPDDLDLSPYDGSGLNPLASSLFVDVMPNEIAYQTDSSTNPDITCTNLGDSSSAGPLLVNHPDHAMISCAYSGSAVLAQGDSISTTISVVVQEGSDLSFTNYAFSGWISSDPDNDTMMSPYGAGSGSVCESGSEILDCYQQNDINNLAVTTPVSDVSISKTLVTPFDATAGNTVSYDVTLHNKGLQAINLDSLRVNGVYIFTDIYPGADLTYIDNDSSNIVCQDLGVGSSAYLGAAASDHPSHNLLLCSYTGGNDVLAVGEDLSLRLNFTVNEGASTSFTNYLLGPNLDADTQQQALTALFGSTTEDVLDTVSNENFAKAAYPAVESDSSDGNGSGLAGTGQNALLIGGIALGLLVAGSITLFVSRKKQA